MISASTVTYLSLAIFCIFVCPSALAVQEPAQVSPTVIRPPAVQLRTLMCERGERIFLDDFDHTTPPGAWGGYSAGEWKSAEGLLRVTYTGGHSLYHEQMMPMKDIIMQISFRFDEGVGSIGLGMEGGPTGHALRWNFHRDSIDLQRMPGVGKSGNDLIASLQTKLSAGRWYTMVMELCGTEMLVTLDESALLYGTADGIDCDKHSIILGADAAGGKYAWFAHCVVWRATLKRGWPQKRDTVKTLLTKPSAVTPDVVNQLLYEDPSRSVPVFPSSSPVAKVAKAQEQLAAGAFNAGYKSLTKLSIDKDPAVAEAATKSLELVAAWKNSVSERIASLVMTGDVYLAAEIAAYLAKCYPDDDGDGFRDRVAILKREPAYAIGKEYQKLAATPFYMRGDPRFARQVKAFVEKYHDNIYASQATQLVVK